jgi:hypothetical protein
MTMWKKKTKMWLRAERPASWPAGDHCASIRPPIPIMVGVVFCLVYFYSREQSYISRPKEVGKLSLICRGRTVWCGFEGHLRVLAYGTESRVSPMAYRIVGHRIEPSKTLSPDALRREFETAVCELHDLDGAAQKRRLQYRTPIVQRAGISVDVEKRALSDAARALAQLWKV